VTEVKSVARAIGGTMVRPRTVRDEGRWVLQQEETPANPRSNSQRYAKTEHAKMLTSLLRRHALNGDCIRALVVLRALLNRHKQLGFLPLWAGVLEAVQATSTSNDTIARALRQLVQLCPVDVEQLAIETALFYSTMGDDNTAYQEIRAQLPLTD